MFQGSIVALVTPMQEDGSLDDAAFRRLIEHHIEQGSDGLVIVGTTGESATLSHQEHCQLLKTAVEQAKGRIPIIGGTGANATAEAIALSKCAKAAGVQASLSVTPYYNKPTQEGLYQHFKAISTAVDLPIILYNVPGRTGCDLLPETVARLAKLPGIIGLKDATGDLMRVRLQRRLCGEDFLLFSGNDDSALELMALGGNGVISVTANVAPKAMHDMCQQALAGNIAAADAIDVTLQGLHSSLFAEPNPIPVKWAVQQQGLLSGVIRLPLTPLSEVHHEAVKSAMQQAEKV
ncbi:4-hydroxy-tetrahydrodipicolinate synthase [Candidatus Venteria ishoeyi]|uniref:4-hydroxy-tetrahydrodipicolinate synthase n=1 Tax=Candidatus Venteria ishoeyi TaxID=1899563 RepID=A0A1H6FE29_9GAMM|nr:4-hydroxy-tetrahydrodipicolinate synthase [Candidatus Venteria ishoeyi]MDM8545880.1 4-hydroxy-tetrahydrodipicolinate synthase [Candidatus Venteria ishoeyi]SEH08340.1 4-hydroxy-tetrahydrodipicolinate synthase [Candidatus Venteria ishoeyi]